MAIDEQVWLDAWNSRNAAPIIAIADPEIEVHAVTLGIDGRHYVGHEGLKQWMRDIRDRFDAYSTAESIEPLGDEDTQVFAMVVHLRDDKASWIGTFFSAADAKAAYNTGVTGPQPG